MRSKKQVRHDFTESTENLLKTLQDFPEAAFNKKPRKDKWSIGQVADHLLKTEVNTLRMLTQEVEPSDRNPEQKIEDIREQFLNFNKKFKAFGPIVPDDSSKEKQEMIDRLQDNRQRLSSIIDIEDLTGLITAFEHPLFGSLTRVEWLYFQIYHSRRHCQQIKIIAERI